MIERNVPNLVIDTYILHDESLDEDSDMSKQAKKGNKANKSKKTPNTNRPATGNGKMIGYFLNGIQMPDKNQCFKRPENPRPRMHRGRNKALFDDTMIFLMFLFQNTLI